MKIIGRFRETYHDDRFPSVLDYINPEEPENKQIILDYLKKGRVTAVYPARLYDAVTKQTQNVSLRCLTDGKYAWRSDLIYYYTKYNVKLDHDFISYIMRKLDDSSPQNR